MDSLKATALHILELAVILGLVWGATQLFPGLIPNETVQAILAVVLSGLAKFARSSPDTGIPDYVNKS
jgi:hypothetical protein